MVVRLTHQKQLRSCFSAERASSLRFFSDCLCENAFNVQFSEWRQAKNIWLGHLWGRRMRRSYECYSALQSEKKIRVLGKRLMELWLGTRGPSPAHAPMICSGRGADLERMRSQGLVRIRQLQHHERNPCSILTWLYRRTSPRLNPGYLRVRCLLREETSVQLSSTASMFNFEIRIRTARMYRIMGSADGNRVEADRVCIYVLLPSGFTCRRKGRAAPVPLHDIRCP